MDLRDAQFTRVVVCLIIFLSEMCYCYPPPYYSSNEENADQAGIRQLFEDWEREGIIRSLLANQVSSSNNNIGSGNGLYNSRHEFMIRKSLRSGGNSNLRLRYGKRNNLPGYELVKITGAADDAKGTRITGAIINDPNGFNRNWKNMAIEQN